MDGDTPDRGGLAAPGKLDLLLVEVGTNRFSGTRDFECRSVRAEGRNGFVAKLFLPAHSLANRSSVPFDFKLAFPHLVGLALSQDPATDYVFFPRGGGIIADRTRTSAKATAIIRRFTRWRN